MMRVTLDVIGDALLGADLSARAEPLVHAVLRALDVVVARAQSPVKLPLSVPTPRNRRLAASLRVLDATVADVVAKRRGAMAGASRRGLSRPARRTSSACCSAATPWTTGWCATRS